jgi:cytochrome P450
MVARPRLRKRRLPTVDISAAALEANPYPVYRWLREHAPVAVAPGIEGRCLVTRWSETEELLKDDDRFVTPAHGPPPGLRTIGGSMLFLNGDEHARIRSAMQPACQPRRASAFAADAVVANADALLDALERDGEGDLVGGFFEPLAAAGVRGLLGLDGVPVDDLRHWLDAIVGYFRGEPLPRHAPDANARLDDALRSRVQAARPDGEPALLDVMQAAGLTDGEILANAKVFAAAGMHELRDLMAHTLLGLLTRPEQLAELRADAALARAAVEEGARWASPVGMVGRLAATDVELNGVRVPAGTLLSGIIASANRDEARWTRPDRFDLHRDEGMHLAFASGVHFCLGAWLARAGGAAALQHLLERLPRLRLREGGGLAISGWRFRVVHRLPAAWS